MRCPACGSENSEAKRFCEDCGHPLLPVCPACGAQLGLGKRFCGECGTPVAAAVMPAPPPGEPAQVLPPPQKVPATPTELRHVSVLFCDLVGFTTFSEKRDAEEVREFLSGYFELARAIVARYGGVVEKFIGDAVMALWGAPVAKEDDAELAVRAGLELVSAVAAYGAERENAGLQARVGIVTGGAATTETPEEGLVIGDRVNTAARIQSAAPPGCCYVDATTRAASAAAIAYSDAGEHTLKGKTERIHLYQATRVVAATAGSQRSGVLEAPFTGRDHELRLVKELFHASAERRSARLVLVSGVAGVGKSRLAWEFFKYVDGLADGVLWHAGRCLSYGEGVSYWALSEMVRARLQIGEEDPLGVVAERLTSGLERWIPDASDREFIYLRLAQLLGLSSAQSLAREELFLGWRLFFERLAEHLPVVMVVEDLQWADSGMVDFLDHLLDWSADHAIFLLVLTRPEGADQAGLVLSRRNLTTLSLDPLSDEVIGELLDGLVADLPRAGRARIVERAEGIPLYAIETVRSLLDRGVLEKGEDDLLHLIGELGELEIPPGLTALIASRLDALSPAERRVVKGCAVLGESFPRQAIEAVSDAGPGELNEILPSLVRKEVLTVRADKLSPERGQYAFTQSLIRSVAYDMLTRGERKARHLTTAAHMRHVFPDEGAEVIEVIAAHLHDAYKAAGDDPDSDELRARAKDAYVHAGDRAEAVGAPGAAETAYLTASELSSDDEERARFIEKSAEMAMRIGADDRALNGFEKAGASHLQAGRIVDAARVAAWIGTMFVRTSRSEQAVACLSDALSSLDPATAPPAVVARLEERLGRALMFTGRSQDAGEPIERALTLAQHHELAETYASALQMKAYLYSGAGRVEEGILNLEGSLATARKNGLVQVESAAQNLLTDLCMIYDRPGAEEHALAGLALARRQGARGREADMVGNLMYVLMLAGRWDEAARFADEVLESAAGEATVNTSLLRFRKAFIDALRGELASARQQFAYCESWKDAEDVQASAMYSSGAGALALAAGEYRNALDTATRAIEGALTAGLPLAHEVVRLSFPDAVDAAIAGGDLEAADRLLELFANRPLGEIPQFLRAQVTRTKALLAIARGRDAGVEDDLIAAETVFRGLGYPIWLARAQLDRAEWLARQGRLVESARIAEQAAAGFETVGAVPMLARARALLESQAVG
ncbi:MAG: adenylate/guanylate cyclase domain-containing protein [Acidimicrobiales bacterium]